MNRIVFAAAVASITALGACSPKKGDSPAAAPVPQTEEQKTMFALGMTVGRSLKVFELTPEELALVKAGMEAQMSGADAGVALDTYGPKIQDMARARQAQHAMKQKEKSKAFLDTAAKEAGAQVTPSGMVYVTLKEGTGPAPAATDMVKVHYRGTLTTGEEFDSSYKRNEPATFPLNGVIRCWGEGVPKMKVGGKAKLVCPSDIAYGDRGQPPTIPGGATLVFEIELLEIVANPNPQPPLGQ